MAHQMHYGYDIGPNESLVINPDETEIVRWISDQYISGRSLGAIAAKLEKMGSFLPPESLCYELLKEENLRDNMTTLELVLNMLAEATTTEISRQKAPETFAENMTIAREGGKVAGDAQKAFFAFVTGLSGATSILMILICI